MNSQFSRKPVARVMYIVALALAATTFSFAASGAWSPTGTMQSARDGHTATILANGKILVAGGTNDGLALTSAELYNPTARTWAFTGSMHVGRTLARAVQLSNGSVLVMGGCVDDCLSATTSSAELYNPTAGTFTATGSMVQARAEFGVTLLANGQVLVAGGCTGYNQNGCGATTTSAEIYDPATRTWTLGNRMVQARSDYASIMLSSGKILFTGGENINGVSINNAELYNPSTGRFTATGNMTATRVEHTAVLLSNGNVLVSGGNNQTLGGVTPLASAELYNAATGTWSATGSMSNARAGHTSTVLHNGNVVNAGGSDAVTELDSAELYTP